LKPVLLFDVNETLLSVDALRPAFLRTFGDANVLKEWFDAVLLYSQTFAVKTLSNYSNHLFQTSVDPAFQKYVWQPDMELVKTR
jgi:hypothetical protein